MTLLSMFAAAGDVLRPDNCGKTSRTNPNDCLTAFPEVAGNSAQLQNILVIIFGILGAVAVIVIFMAAINFAFAGSDPDKLKRARDTILYALIGLIIAMTAEAITLFVLGRI